MIRVVAFVLAGLVAGLGIAWWQGIRSSGGEFGPGDVDGAERARIERRISELETELRLERFERQALADEVDALRGAAAASAGLRDSAVRGNPAVVIADPDANPQNFPPDVRVWFEDAIPQDEAAFAELREQRQIARFVEVGFAPDRAQWLLQREDELEMEVLRERYAARQGGVSDQQIADMTLSRAMREELGDADYEKYLRGMGRPTAVDVREVLANSPARAVGVQAGDQILSYNGSRVFEIGELSRLAETARPGSTVVLEVERGGQRLQFYIEAGPLGISGGGTSTRRDFDGNR